MITMCTMYNGHSTESIDQTKIKVTKFTHINIRRSWRLCSINIKLSILSTYLTIQNLNHGRYFDSLYASYISLILHYGSMNKPIPYVSSYTIFQANDTNISLTYKGQQCMSYNRIIIHIHHDNACLPSFYPLRWYRVMYSAWLLSMSSYARLQFLQILQTQL